MKHAVWGFFMVAIALTLILIIATIVGRMQRTTEVNSTLSEAVEQSVNSVVNKKTYLISDKDEFVSDVLQNLLNSYENNAEITVKIATADEEKGLLGLKVIEKFKKANGAITEETYEKIVLLETGESETTYQITFLTEDGDIFQKISINSNESIVLPEIKPEGISTWAKLEDDGTKIAMSDDDIKCLLVDKNLTFIALS